jgi:preprotein translocase subunit SecF
MFGLSSILIRLALATTLLSAITGGYFYVKSLQTEIELAKEVQAKMQGVINKQNLAMDNLRADIERQGQVQAELSKEISAAQQDNIELSKKFTQDADGKERNLSSLANQQPSLVEGKVNQGTKDALRCNEIVTGSPLTPEEISGKVKNNICPDLLPKPEVKKK